MVAQSLELQNEKRKWLTIFPNRHHSSMKQKSLNPLLHDITPLDAFEILLCIWKYYGKWSICSLYFQKYSKLYLNFSYFFSMLSKSGKWYHDLKIAYGVKGVSKFWNNFRNLTRGPPLAHQWNTIWMAFCWQEDSRPRLFTGWDKHNPNRHYTLNTLNSTSIAWSISFTHWLKQKEVNRF